MGLAAATLFAADSAQAARAATPAEANALVHSLGAGSGGSYLDAGESRL